jgi:hypothetical protein
VSAGRVDASLAPHCPRLVRATPPAWPFGYGRRDYVLDTAKDMALRSAAVSIAGGSGNYGTEGVANIGVPWTAARRSSRSQPFGSGLTTHVCTAPFPEVLINNAQRV